MPALRRPVAVAVAVAAAGPALQVLAVQQPVEHPEYPQARCQVQSLVAAAAVEIHSSHCPAQRVPGFAACWKEAAAHPCVDLLVGAPCWSYLWLPACRLWAPNPLQEAGQVPSWAEALALLLRVAQSETAIETLAATLT
eukprot:scaffold237195_cov14-Tisochrysis_lutea.AAC.1